MKILYITAGAAGMYCGSCLLDNALATELMAQGHEVLLLPIYTPTLTDERNVSQPRVFFSGIGIYLEQHLPFFRKTPWTLDRLWESPWLLKFFSGRGISPDPRLLGELTLSMLKGETGHFRKEFEKLVHWLRSEPAPQIVHLPNSLLISLAKPLRELLHCPVCCTIQGEDLFLSHLQDPYRQRATELITSQVDAVDAFFFSHRSYASAMTRLLSIPEHKVFTIPFGINPSGFSPAEQARSPVFTIGFFARVAPEKGLHVLCDAYIRLRREGFLTRSRLLAGGYKGPEHQAYFESIQQKMHNSGFQSEFIYQGVLDKAGKANFYRTLDVFSLPATYDEPKGLSVLEAMASGVPVVLPRRGAFIEMIHNTSAGLLYDPDDDKGLSQALYRLFEDRALSEEFAKNGPAGVQRHYSIHGMAQQVLDVYQRLQI